MQKLTLFYNAFIPEKLTDDPFILRKAKVLTNLILFLILTGIILQVLTLAFNPDNPILIYPGIVAGFFLLFLFKKTGNSVLVSNLLAVFWVLPLMYVIPETKGLYSDNVLWLFLAPLSVLLFANRKYGTLWLFILLAYVYYLYLYHSHKDLLETAVSADQSEYYLISYAFLFIAIFFVVVIFETGQVLTIQLLKKQKAILEEQKQEIARKNAELQAIEEQLRETNQELENFAFAASHDLKEPLRMIGMYTQLTRKRLDKDLDGTTKEFMGFVTEGVGRMQVLLDSLLDYSRLGKNQEDLRDVNLNDTIFMVIHNLMPRMKETQAEILANPLPTLQASSFEMIQLFQNLIANSIKFRRPNVPPTIEIKVHETPAGDFKFTVKDNGIGIPEQHQERVFKIFERLHTRVDYEGSGIGLATCKKIVQSSGGKIWLESTEGVGTTFHFTLPKIMAN
jgi:signal transduction histidine kinase